jgi:NADH-quinone oxidoreductase subunit G
VCPECSYGCNINVDSRDFEVKRFASRDNPLVDDMWLCDRGRYSFDRWNSAERVRRPLVRGGRSARCLRSEAITQAARRLREISDEYGACIDRGARFAASTNEELFLLERLARQVIGTPHVDHQLEPFDGLSAAEHELGIAEIEECDTLVVLGAEPEEQAPVLTLRLYKAERKKSARVIRLGAARRRRGCGRCCKGWPRGSASSPTRPIGRMPVRLRRHSRRSALCGGSPSRAA